MQQKRWVEACGTQDVAESAIVERKVDGHEVVLMRQGDRFYAAQAVCPHMDERLCDGLLKKNRLICTKHLWQWDIESGQALGAAEKPLMMYPTRVEGSLVYVGLEPENS
ncbi:ferredoxin [Bordetella trematum]|uniref:Ferredoxin n=1 Tax=Bordetella trematum TaxID=123899 RepID=A0A157QK91_9BORD|nr:Rieske 2Fe-2S domain-containing protein [Bordetella trematum]AUL46000.1 ferredoxin [Bordetella trematum]AZR92753.1 ferredoxin [Bordetella trematum]NNH18038.1 Rieske 2Fe-2S domain-containing protein [Bordetella trematum]QIM71360.1 ferredoxin [Bordetella trematum]SAI30274.1 ferredoxin [Bordetella trematum]